MVYSATIQPIDTLFFKDGKSFDSDDTTTAEVIFPPFPSVFYGALRTAYSRKERSNIPHLNSENDRTSKLVIHDIAILYNGIKYYPLPADLVVDIEGSIHKLSLEAAPDLSSHSLPNVLLNRVNAKQVDGQSWMLNSRQLEQYFKGGSLQSQKALSLNEIVAKESKTGNEGDVNTGSVKQGMLYTKQLIRPHFKAYFELVYSGLNLEGIQWLKLGGESRMSAFMQADEQPEITPCIDQNEFVVYLHTPAIFLDKTKIRSSNLPQLFLEKYGLELLAMATHRPAYVGGYDVKNNQPKPMYKAVSAGSVFYVKQTGTEKVPIPLKGAMSDLYAEQGFGIYSIRNLKAD